MSGVTIQRVGASAGSSSNSGNNNAAVATPVPPAGRGAAAPLMDGNPAVVGDWIALLLHRLQPHLQNDAVYLATVLGLLGVLYVLVRRAIRLPWLTRQMPPPQY